jgi:hypothetical protein
MFSFKTTKGASRVSSMVVDDDSADYSPDEQDVRMLNAIFSASVVLQDAAVSNGILSGE